MRNSFKEFEEEIVRSAPPPSPNIERNITNVVSNSRNLSSIFEHYFVKSFRLIGVLFGSEKSDNTQNHDHRNSPPYNQ